MNRQTAPGAGEPGAAIISFIQDTSVVTRRTSCLTHSPLNGKRRPARPHRGMRYERA
jgi:hypothetical protein